MTNMEMGVTRVVETDAGGLTMPRLDWSSIVAGAAVACAIIAVMAAFGAGIGLSLASPYGGAIKWGLALAFAIWMLWITVSAFAAGGYVCGRMRPRLGDVRTHETEVRDGAHGVVVWALALIVTLALALPAFSTHDTKSDARGGVTGASSATDPVANGADTLLRQERAGAPFAADQDTRAEVVRILSGDLANGGVAQDDRAFLDRVVESRAGLSANDADARVSAVLARVKADANRARKIGVLLAFITAACFAIGAAAAWWGAGVGGRHRDDAYDASAWTRW